MVIVARVQVNFSSEHAVKVKVKVKVDGEVKSKSVSEGILVRSIRNSGGFVRVTGRS